MNELEGKLVKNQWIRPEELIAAKEEQRKTRKSIFACLIKLGYMSEEDIFIFFAETSQIPFVRLADYAIQEDILKLLPEAFCRDNLVMPLWIIEQEVFVVMADPLDAETVKSINHQIPYTVHYLIANPSAIRKNLDKYFGPKDNFFKIEEYICKPAGLQEFPFQRESERISIFVPLEFKLDDKRVMFHSPSYIPATMLNISKSGTAAGIKTCAFLPSGVNLLLNFSSFAPKPKEAEACVVYCRLEEKGKFYMGIKFLGLDQDTIIRLLESK
ncbi:MAG: PilZ domain-containing protein [Candidatus Omnitrophota bacterium]